jgi:hypothetical protein
VPTYDVTQFFMLQHKTSTYRIVADSEEQAIYEATKLLNEDKTFRAKSCDVAYGAEPDWDDSSCAPEVDEVEP